MKNNEKTLFIDAQHIAEQAEIIHKKSALLRKKVERLAAVVNELLQHTDEQTRQRVREMLKAC